MISSLGINPHECEAMFDDIPTIVAKNEFVTDVSRELRRDLDMREPEDKQLLARNIFVFGQCMEGTQFYGLFGMILSLYRQGKLPGIGTMFRYTLRDESNHIEVFRQPAARARRGEPRDLDAGFREELRDLMPEAVALEQRLHRGLPAGRRRRPERDRVLDRTSTTSPTGASRASASRRCTAALENPLPWLAELMDVRKEQNFFEGRVTEYQKASALAAVADEEL